MRQQMWSHPVDASQNTCWCDACWCQMIQWRNQLCYLVMLHVFRWTGDANHHRADQGKDRIQRHIPLQSIVIPSQSLHMALQWHSGGQYICLWNTSTYQKHEWGVHLQSLQQRHRAKQYCTHNAYCCRWGSACYFYVSVKYKHIQERSKQVQERTFNFLFVSDPIEDVRIEALEKPPIEGKLYELHCNVTGPAEYVYWMKNGMKLHRHNTTFWSMDNKTLTFKPLTRHDTGNYSCKAMNAVGNMTSALYRLLVNCEYNIERIFTADRFIHCSVVCHPALLLLLVYRTVRTCCFLCYCSWTRSPSHLWARVCWDWKVCHLQLLCHVTAPQSFHLVVQWHRSFQYFNVQNRSFNFEHEWRIHLRGIQ